MTAFGLKAMIQGVGMIRNQWYVILQSKEVKRNKIVGVLRMGERMVLWRDAQGKIVCQADHCPHRGVALSVGCLKGDTIQCPFHGFAYDANGKCTYVPANGKASEPPKALQVATYLTHEEHGYIYIWWGDPQPEYPPIPWFDDLDTSFTTSDFKDIWNAHYSRVIENQLDVFHLPFVHATTIGRGNRTIADGPITVVDPLSLEIWVHNRLDDGISTAKRAGELPAPDRPFLLKFKFPHLWMNRISEDMRITVYFTPIDANNTALYLRYYQRFVKIPGLRELVAFLINLSSIVILNQDKRVVITQTPKASGLNIGEKLIPADRPIIEYRKIREKLQQKEN
jgi:phenylpropionate dioxygenase-like ring-hydroxylating dioxygenase large terminal subunit